MISYKKNCILVVTVLACLCFAQVKAQDLQADNMLVLQRSNGGWSKQFKGKAFDYARFTAADKPDMEAEAKKDDANIDNNATNKEIRYLLKAYKQTNNTQYLAAAEHGIRYLLAAQYNNGGWPQYYPDKSLYRAHITYNDNAMINALNVLQDVVLKQHDFDAVNPQLIAPSARAVSKGIDCILKTQIKVNGILTAWCQQYDETTLQPAKARAYELPSISGSETVGIVDFLMSQPHPGREIKDAVNAAAAWLERVKIAGYKVVDMSAPGTEKGTDRQLVADTASIIWARYYEIGSNRPFFCDRDGIKKYALQEIGYERRNGYAWYGTWAKTLLEKRYPEWAKNKLE